MKLFYIIGFLLLFQINSFSQSINTDPFNNRIVLKYYSIPELTAIKNDYYERYKKIKYYYIHSFIIDTTSLASCPNFNPQLFDVSEYESYRNPERRIEVTLPCGVKVTLKTNRELYELILYDGVLPSTGNEYER